MTAEPSEHLLPPGDPKCSQSRCSTPQSDLQSALPWPFWDLRFPTLSLFIAPAQLQFARILRVLRARRAVNRYPPDVNNRPILEIYKKTSLPPSFSKGRDHHHHRHHPSIYQHLHPSTRAQDASVTYNNNNKNITTTNNIIYHSSQQQAYTSAVDCLLHQVTNNNNSNQQHQQPKT